jgi:hypothetical protein
MKLLHWTQVSSLQCDQLVLHTKEDAASNKGKVRCGLVLTLTSLSLRLL